jgi:hypothetical protein
VKVRAAVALVVLRWYMRAAGNDRVSQTSIVS